MDNMFDKLFEINVPIISEGIMDRSPDSKSIETIAYIDQNRFLLDDIWELRRQSAQLDYKKRLLRIALPATLFVTALTCAGSKPNERFEAALIALPINSIFNIWVAKKITELKWKSSTNSLIDEHISGINDDNESSNTVCSGCIYYSEESQNAGVKYAQCAVQPLLVNTPEAVDCRDRG